MTTARIEIVAVGRPQPQGWLKAVTLPGRKFTVLVDGNKKLRAWRKTVRKAAEAVMRDHQPFERETPVVAQLQFCFRRPKSAKSRTHPTVKPDLDKLVRGCLDSLTGVVWIDDAQVVRVMTAKHYGEFERVEIRVEAA